jgi:hypothetical protein
VLRAIKVLLALWHRTRDPEPEFVDGWVKVLSKYPAAIVEEAIDGYSGVAAAHPKYPPGAGALRAWCEAREDYYRKIAAEARSDVPPVRPAPTAQDRAHVAAKAAWCIGGLARAMGKRVRDDLRAEDEAKLAIAAAWHDQRVKDIAREKAEAAQREAEAWLENAAEEADEQPPGDD